MTAPGSAAGPVEMVPGPDAALSLAVAEALRGHRGANPLVGAVVTAPDGAVLAAGFHRGRGTAHAEVAALEQFAATSEVPPADATLWVTLEPCDHTGSTGPCTEAILASGIRRVRYAVADPTGHDGGGAARLRRSGLDVEQAGPAVTEASGADGLNRRWLAARDDGRPFVTAHLAQSLDGRVAAADGTSQWITGTESRRHAHAVRSRVDAIVVGTGTVAADDPRLTARDAAGQDLAVQPVPVVQGRRKVSGDAALRRGPGSGPERAPRDWLHVREHEPRAVLDRLRQARTTWPHGGDRPGHLLIEGGPTVLAAWLGAGLVDEMFVYQAPLVLGGGPTGLDLPHLTTLNQALRLQPDPAENGGLSRLGDDVLLHYAAH